MSSEYRDSGAARPLATRAQRRLWLAEQLSDGTGEYNVPVGLRIHGPLDRAALLAAIREIVARHESLRSTLEIGFGGKVRRRAHHPESFEVELRDFSAGTRPDEAVADFVEERARRPFDLAREVLRIALVILAEEDHVLLCVGHHVIFDDWSVMVFFRELEVLYRAAVEGADPSAVLPPVKYTCLDLGLEEQRAVTRGELDEQFAYWTRLLSGASPLPLPAGRPCAGERSARAGQHRFRLDTDLVNALTQLGRSYGASLFMTLMAGFHALLREWTDRTDVTTGTLVSGRGSADHEQLITCMVNTLAVRSVSPREASFAVLLREIRERVLEAFANQDAPFDEVLTRLPNDVKRHGSRLLTTMFEFQNTTMDVAALSGGDGSLPTLRGVRTTAYPARGLVSRYDLEFALGATGDGLSGRIVYPLDSFSSSTIESLAENYVRLLRAAVRTPQRALFSGQP